MASRFNEGDMIRVVQSAPDIGDPPVGTVGLVVHIPSVAANVWVSHVRFFPVAGWDYRTHSANWSAVHQSWAMTDEQLERIDDQS